ncbi:MAG: zf-HC2 domain-containing protein [Polyangiaceae bacterium]
MRFPSNAECAHAPIVEALHDGRLGAQEKASIERHLATCATCAAHRQWLLTIREHVRVPPIDTADPSPLEHQRARSALLRKAVNLDASNRTVSSPLRAWAVPFAAVAFVALALFVGWSWGRSSVPAAVARASATVSEPRAQSTVDPESGARGSSARGSGIWTR